MTEQLTAGRNAYNSSQEENELYRARAISSRDGENDNSNINALALSNRNKTYARERDSNNRGDIQSPYFNSELSTPTAVMSWKLNNNNNNNKINKGNDRNREKDMNNKNKNSNNNDNNNYHENDKVFEENKKSSPLTKSRSIKLEKEKIEIEKRKRLEYENQNMQDELVRTSEALDTLQQLLRDREKSSLRKAKLFLSEKELLESEIKNMKINITLSDNEVIKLLEEKDYMLRRMDEFGKQLNDLAEGNTDNDGIDFDYFGNLSPETNNSNNKSNSYSNNNLYNSPDSKMKKKRNINMNNSSIKHNENVSNQQAREKDNFTGNKNVQDEARKRERSSERGREKSVLESEGAIELDVVIQSMQNVVNDRKRVRRLCRHQQLSIMALR